MVASRVSDAPDDPASPACLAHEADDAYMGFAGEAEIAAVREEFGIAERSGFNARLAAKLREILPRIRDDTVYRDLSEKLRAYEAVR